MSSSAPKPFTLNVSDADIADLRQRLTRTRWPDEPPYEPWSTGASLAYMQELCRYWQSGFDWRQWEAKLNGFRQFTVNLDGTDLHFIHEPGRGPNPMPLLISHGWPGSVFEFHKLIPLLTERFTVVAPSLPGYTLSFRPGQKRFGITEIADLYADLMTDVLGYKRFGAQGGDWGAFAASVLGHRHPERTIGIHLNLLAVRRDTNMIANPTPEEKAFLDELAHFLKEETGYQWIQGTRPQTLAFGLSDSPAGLAAWIVEKFRAWTDCGGNPDAWQETILQVEDIPAPEGKTFMAVGKFRAILGQVDRKVRLAGDARLTLEVSRPDEAMRIYDVAAIDIEPDRAIVQLGERPAICKPRHRAAQAGAAACCGPATSASTGSSCCA